MSADDWYDTALDLEAVAPDEAVTAYHEALALEPGHADAHVNVGRILHEQGDLSEAEFELTRSAVLRRLDALLDRPRDIAGYRLYGLATGREFCPQRAAEAVKQLTVDDVCKAAGAFSLDTVYLLEGVAT